MEVIGRKAEQEDLQRYYESDRPEFLAVYGRRRVGKTYLIKEFFKNDFTFYTTGLANAPKSGQLEAFAEALRIYGGQSAAHSTAQSAMQSAAPKSWFQAFLLLRNLLEQSDRIGKKVVFIDEMPWLDTPRSGFLSGLEYFWNSWASSRPDILLIVCGSVSSWMINRLLKNHGGLYNRVTQRMHLAPFSLRECEEFFQKSAVMLSRYQILEYYMVFGGIPYYLGMIHKAYSVAQNIDRLCFAEGAPLRNEFEDMLSSLFRNSEQHRLIIRTLAKKAKGFTREELLKATGLPNGGNFTKVLEELEQSGFLRRYRGFSKKTKESLFQLVDFFCNFHFRYLVDLDGGEEGYWAAFSATPGHNAWSGYAFEQVCMAHLQQIKQKLGIAGVIAPVFSWRSTHNADKGSSHEKGAQIDLLIDRNDNIVNLCEMKYSIDEFVIDAAYDKQLREKRASFIRETKTRKAVHLTMVTTYGLTHNAYWGNIQSEVTAEDLFG
jgi:AAA+ ATPase superfamily predicted ATPase